MSCTGAAMRITSIVLVADGDDAVTARHDSVIEMLEQVLAAEALVPAGQERQPRQPRRDERAPGAGAAERMDAVAALLAREPPQREDVAQDADRTGGGDVERHELGAGRVDVGEQAPGARDEDGVMEGVLAEA